MSEPLNSTNAKLELSTDLVDRPITESTPMQDQRSPTGNKQDIVSETNGASKANGASGMIKGAAVAKGTSCEETLEATPTVNQSLAFKLDYFETLTSALDYAAQGETGYNFYTLRGKVKEVLSYRDLRVKAKNLAAILSDRFERGSHLCLVAETSADFIITFFACQYAGMVPAPMPVPVNLGGKNGYILQLKQMMKGAGAKAAIGPVTIQSFLEEAAESVSGIEILTYDALMSLKASDTTPIQFRSDEKCYIQYSSGSTSAPKGVIGTQKSVTHNLHAIVNHGLRLNDKDRAVSWLPLYHDMGLIGFALSPLFAQRTVDFIATSDFVRRPMLWLNVISSTGATATYSPSFGYELAAKRVKASDKASLNLSKLRVAGIGGDMVRAEALDSFAKAFEDVGFDAKAFTPSYGLAEATLAISFSDLESPVGVDDVDMRHYNRSGIAQPVTALTSQEHKRTFVKCGQVLPGHDLEVRNDNGKVNDDRVVGRIFIKGPSLTSGYYSDEAASKAMFHGDWLDTGDMGYSLDGDLIITGRAKDLIIINGRNIWPQDIEWAVEGVESVRQGGVAAFSIDMNSGERVVCIVECRGGLTDDERENLRREIAQVIQRAAGAPAEVVLVRPHSMVVTSSGKLSRAKVREKYLQGAFDNTASMTQDAKAVNMKS